MSQLTSFFLIFLLCISQNACSARRLGAVDHNHNNNKLQKKLRFSIKNDMKSGFNKNSDVVVHDAKSSPSIKEDDATQKLEDSEVTNNKTEKTWGEVEANKSVASSVSWRVPHRKHGEKHPGFNLDYSPPKTHPPSHN